MNKVSGYYDYDIFGSPVAGDFTTGADYGYLGKPYDSITGLYNYGYRDYSPQTVRFTTIDPIRDGSNWFAYVNNDPVNYVDLWGLLASDGKRDNIFQNDLAEVSGTGVATPVGKTWNDAQYVTSRWGYRESFSTSKGDTLPGHNGMDFAAPEGTRINAVMDGVVTKVIDDSEHASGYGKHIEITHGNGVHTLYGHQSRITVQQGQHVKAGEKVGEVGSTGKSSGPHLHFGYDGNGDGSYSKTDREDNPESLLYSWEN